MKTLTKQFTTIIEPFPVPDEVLAALLQAVKARDASILRWAEKEIGKKCAKSDFVYMKLKEEMEAL